MARSKRIVVLGCLVGNRIQSMPGWNQKKGLRLGDHSGDAIKVQAVAVPDFPVPDFPRYHPFEVGREETQYPGIRASYFVGSVNCRVLTWLNFESRMSS